MHLQVDCCDEVGVLVYRFAFVEKNALILLQRLTQRGGEFIQ